MSCVAPPRYWIWVQVDWNCLPYLPTLFILTGSFSLIGTLIGVLNLYPITNHRLSSHCGPPCNLDPPIRQSLITDLFSHILLDLLGLICTPSLCQCGSPDVYSGGSSPYPFPSGVFSSTAPPLFRFFLTYFYLHKKPIRIYWWLLRFLLASWPSGGLAHQPFFH